MKSKLSGALAIGAAALVFSVHALASTITFETVPLGGTAGPAGAWRGDNGAADLTIDGAHFYNNNADYGFGWPYWSGFSFSTLTNTTLGDFTNDLSAYPGHGAGGSTTYAIGYYTTFDPVTTRIELSAPLNMAGLGASIANTTYTALSIPVEDGFSHPFTNGDYLRLTITGYNGLTATGSAEYFLADFRDGKTFVLADWAVVDLSALGTADRLEFTMDSTDDGKPTYFALDNLFAPIPEPSSVLLSFAGLALMARRKR